jgi:NTP pyrophosphatase (non-canonical NTP hydrolase)
MEPFNKLTPAEVERLAILAEECGEVIQIVGKILRHGYDSYNPNDEHWTPNRQLLQKELGDVLWIVSKMDAAVDINFHMATPVADLAARFHRKESSASPYLHHQSDAPVTR